MEYIIENAYLQVTVQSLGAELTSVIRKSDGVEHMWEADPALWGQHAPILFPHTGRLKDGVLSIDGNLREGVIHGFARDLEHTLVYRNRDTLVLQLTETQETLAYWPWKFRLLSVFSLEEDTLVHTLTVENRDDRSMQFGIGFHPGFAVPFDNAHSYQDYELRFSQTESPICLDCAPRGLINGKLYLLGNNIRTIALDEHLFDNDSHCMVNLSSKTLGLYEKDTGRGVVCSLEGFPYTVIWSKPGAPRFVCIEPWNSLPDSEDSRNIWEEKPAAAVLSPGETYSTTMRTAFVR